MSALLQELDAINLLNPKERFKKLRSFLYTVGQNLTTLELSEIAPLIKATNGVLRVTGFAADFSKLKTNLIKHRLSLMGIPEPKTILQKRGSVAIESGVICAGDPQVIGTYVFTDYLGKDFEKCMLEHKGLVFSTGSDGLFSITVRLVDCAEPILETKEYAKVTANTDTTIIEVTSNNFIVSDLSNFQNPKIKIKLESGFYKTCAYLLSDARGISRRFVVVIAQSSIPTETEPVGFFTLE